MKKLLLSLFAAGSVMAAAAPASADIRVGVLRCEVSPGIGYVIVSSKELRYRGYITRVGLDVGFTTGGAIGWWVFAPSRPGAGALAGGYYGASAEATIAAGVGANALVGGLNNSITLQPFSLAAQGGALVANLSVGAVAAAEGTATAWAVAGALLALTGVMVAAPLRRSLNRAVA